MYGQLGEERAFQVEGLEQQHSGGQELVGLSLVRAWDLWRLDRDK